MLLPTGTTVAVADGHKLVLFRNTGTATEPQLQALPHAEVDTHNKSSGARKRPEDNQNKDNVDEDSFAIGVAELLNTLAQGGDMDKLLIIAAPRALGQMRGRYGKILQGKLLGEIGKELANDSNPDIVKAIVAA